MLTTNPFAENVLNIPSYALQGFLILMVIFTIGGVLLDMMHKKNVKFFFEWQDFVRSVIFFFGMF